MSHINNSYVPAVQTGLAVLHKSEATENFCSSSQSSHALQFHNHFLTVIHQPAILVRIQNETNHSTKIQADISTASDTPVLLLGGVLKRTIPAV
ncbi:hypothetical protein Q7C36_020267 [Tachysurus vachellii]|uniref:Uncharacterized protein n=1 Tax=Tachysurus vachellii TaxID=175792 RepID=A0AA88RZC8_TACVA|nr:hypothetical protein Q7C36_020267 [Tachysurus vachellii]